MRPLGRIRDAWRVLTGRSEPQLELARMKATFTDLMVDVTNALEKLNAMSARLAKRESRSLAAAAEDAPPKPEPAPAQVTSRKAALHRRAAELRQLRKGA